MARRNTYNQPITDWVTCRVAWQTLAGCQAGAGSQTHHTTPHLYHIATQPPWTLLRVVPARLLQTDNAMAASMVACVQPACLPACLALTLSPAQASSSIDECERLTKRYQPGQAVHAVVLHVDAQRHALDVSLQPAVPGAVPTAAAGAASTDADADADAAAAAAAAAPKAGSVVLGRITAVGGGGVRVQLSARCTGRVALTDIHDSAVQQVLAGLEEGQYCRAAVLGPDPACSQTSSSGKGGSKGGKGKGGKGKGGKGGKDSSKDSGADNSSQLLLSLRPAAGGQCAAHAAAAAAEQQVAGLAPGQLQPKSLKPGQKVAGYVKSAGQAGVFVCLARNLDARIRWVTGLVGHSR